MNDNIRNILLEVDRLDKEITEQNKHLDVLRAIRVTLQHNALALHKEED